MLHQLKIVEGALLCPSLLLIALPSLAQIVPDATLPNNSNIINQGNTSNITGGTRAGRNLFHSFSEFSIPSKGVAFFNNASDIQNIISRVTGSSISNIDGLIRANGTANLFLINPNGIIFGTNARLNIGGSFLASTASSLKFASGTQFSATEPQTTPLLTMSVPIGLQFGTNPGRIVVQGDGQGIRLLTDPIIDTTAGLRVQPNQTLALVGGDLMLQGATLKTAGGQIELGSVTDSGLVSLTPISKGWALGYSGVAASGNIQLSGRADVDASGNGSGDIQVWGRRVALQDGSQIENSTLGAKPGGNLNVTASESVELIGTTVDGKLRSGLFTQSYPEANGAGGNLNVKTGHLIIRDGALLNTATFGVGKGGHLIINALNSVEVIGFSPVNPQLLTNLGIVNLGSGDAGNFTLSTGNLIIKDGGTLGSTTFGSSKGGNVTINTTNSIEVSGISPNFSPSSLTASTFARGNASQLEIHSPKIIITDGGSINSSSFGPGNAGSVFVDASDFIRIDGRISGPQFPISSNLASSTSVVNQGLKQAVNAQTPQQVFNPSSALSGNSGSVTISTNQLSITGGALATVQNDGTGTAGTLKINVRSIFIDDKGGITGIASSGKGGDIDLYARNLLLLRHASQISATAGTAKAGGNGGNITIKTPFIVAVPSENSDISANAYTGKGGNINITAQGIFGIQPRNQDTPLSDITASSQFGINGTVQINILNPTTVQEVQILPTSTVDPTKLIAPACAASVGPHANSFIITGTGGLLPSPSDLQNSDSNTPWAEPGSNAPSTKVSSAQVSDQSTPAIVPSTEIEYYGGPLVEAQAMVRGKDGDVILTADAPTLTPDIPWLKPSSCQMH